MFQETSSEIRFKDLTLGQEAIIPPGMGGGGIIVTREMQKNFMSTTGDVNPMHICEEFAQTKGYESVICYGMLTASFYSTLVGVYLPGKYAIFQEANVSFSKPVYIGDSLRVKGRITEINEALKRVTIKAEIRNQKNERVSKATLEVGLTE